MIVFTVRQRLRHIWIRSRFHRWIVPVVCAVPYIGSMLWLLLRGQVWIVQIMLAPLVMAGLLAGLTVLLSYLEFRR